MKADHKRNLKAVFRRKTLLRNFLQGIRSFQEHIPNFSKYHFQEVLKLVLCLTFLGKFLLNLFLVVNSTLAE